MSHLMVALHYTAKLNFLLAGWLNEAGGPLCVLYVPFPRAGVFYLSLQYGGNGFSRKRLYPPRTEKWSRLGLVSFPPWWGRCFASLGYGRERGPPDERKGPLTCGGAKGTRTPNPLLAKQVRYQLRHGPVNTEPARTRRAGGIRDCRCAQPLGESVASAQSRFSACLDLICFCTATAPTAVATRRRIFFTGFTTWE